MAFSYERGTPVTLMTPRLKVVDGEELVRVLGQARLVEKDLS